MVPGLHAGTPHHVSLRGFERSHPQLVCVLIREMGSEARAIYLPLTWVSGPDPETRDPALTGALRPETQPEPELRDPRPSP